MTKHRPIRFSLPQRAPLVTPAKNASSPKLGVGASAAKQARPATPAACHSVAHYYNAAGELTNAPGDVKVAR